MLSTLQYKITIQLFNKTNEIITIDSKQSQLTIDIDILKNLQDPRSGFLHLKIYNLNESQAEKLSYEQLIVNDISDNEIIKSRFLSAPRVSISAGFDNNISQIYTGRLVEGYTTIDKTKRTTFLQIQDGYEFFNSPTAQTFNKNSSVNAILRTLSQDVNLQYGIKGIAGAVDDILVRPLSINTDPFTSMLQVIDPKLNLYVENGEVKTLAKDQVLSNKPLVLTSSSNIVKSIVRNQDQYEVGIIFEPYIFLGQQVNIDSIQKNYSGSYKVMKIIHSGKITFHSPEEARMQTTLSLYKTNRLQLLTASLL